MDPLKIGYSNLFADRGSLVEALEYFDDVMSRLLPGDKKAVLTARMVIINTLSKHYDVTPKEPQKFDIDV